MGFPVALIAPFLLSRVVHDYTRAGFGGSTREVSPSEMGAEASCRGAGGFMQVGFRLAKEVGGFYAGEWTQHKNIAGALHNM